MKCNMNCLYCGATDGTGRENELTLDECLSVADELIDMGCRDVTFIGGEIFLYSLWHIVARYLADADVAVNIMSNGYRMDGYHIKQIRHARLSNVDISIDGMEKNHNLIRGKADAFAQAVKSLELLKAEGIPSGAVTTLLDCNYEDLEEMYALFVEIGVNHWQIQLGNPLGSLVGKSSLFIDPGKISELTRFVEEKNRGRRIAMVAADSVDLFGEKETYHRGRKSPISCWGGCQAWINSAYIDSVGNIKGCGSLYSDVFIEGNLRERSLFDIWNDESCFAYNRAFDTTMLPGEYH
jgi:MoaA/NifB/PqqE/SkfB family radical SAM enzyme